MFPDTSLLPLFLLSPGLALPGRPSGTHKGLEVYVDGGIRRGKDMYRALALGATACFCGRPHQWGLSVAGREGVERVVSIFREELTTCMQLAGCADVAHLCPDDIMIKQADRYCRGARL